MRYAWKWPKRQIRRGKDEKKDCQRPARDERYVPSMGTGWTRISPWTTFLRCFLVEAAGLNCCAFVQARKRLCGSLLFNTTRRSKRSPPLPSSNPAPLEQPLTTSNCQEPSPPPPALATHILENKSNDSDMAKTLFAQCHQPCQCLYPGGAESPKSLSTASPRYHGGRSWR